METNLFTNVEQEALIAENEALKAKVADLEAKLAEMEGEQAVALEEELEEEVTAAIEAGKIQAEQKDAWKNFGTMDKVAMKNAINAIIVNGKSLKDIPDPVIITDYENKDEVWNAFKEKKINMTQAGAAIKKLQA